MQISIFKYTDIRTNSHINIHTLKSSLKVDSETHIDSLSYTFTHTHMIWNGEYTA